MKKVLPRPPVLNAVGPFPVHIFPDPPAIKNRPFFLLKTSDTPLPPWDTDFYFIHVSHLDLFNTGSIGNSGIKTGPPVLSCGPADLLRTAFSFGCRDYLKEPWDIEELEIRLSKLLPQQSVRFDWGTIRLTERGIQGNTGFISLSIPEQKIFRQLITHVNQIVFRETIQYSLWGKQKPESRSADMHIVSLRKKLDVLYGGHLDPSPIRTVYGAGYSLWTNCE